MPTPTCSATIKKLLKLSRDPAIDLWAEDEVHFQQHGSRCRMWIPPENSDPLLLHHPTRRSVGYFGAVRLRDGKLFHRRQSDSFNAETFFDYLCRLRHASCRSSRRVVVILDNVRSHHARLHQHWRELQAPRFSLYFLPPYSPELNPSERVWKLTRRLCVHNQYFSALDHLANAVEGQFRRWASPNDTLRRLCAIT